MASKMASDDERRLTCPICLEAPPAVMVGTTCEHVFCRSCLSNHLDKMSPTDEHFPCPTCRIECPLPRSGIDGLPDCNGVSRDETAASKDYMMVEESSTELELGEDVDPVQCHICRYTKESFVEADNVCGDCQNLHICKECTLVHRGNKVTEHHRPIPLKLRKVREEGRCKKHEQWITEYCCDCSNPVCPICIHIEHSDHSLKKLAEVFQAKVELVRQKQANQETSSRYLKNCERELKSLRSMAMDRHDKLVTAVEDQAEKCIEQIIQQKEAMKKKIRTDFKAIFQVTECVKKIPALTTRLDESVMMSEKMISTVEPCPSDLAKLSVLAGEIEETGMITKEIESEDYWESYRKLWKNLPEFSPGTSECNLGCLNVTPKEWNIGKDKLIFDKELEVDDKAKFIPSVTALGRDFYAVAHPTTEGKPFDAVDIYKYPGVFQRTLTLEINPAYDTASTPDGSLAVLSDGATEVTCSVREFDPATGSLTLTRELDVQGRLISFDVNPFSPVLDFCRVIRC